MEEKEKSVEALEKMEQIVGIGKITFIQKKVISEKELERIEKQIEEIEEKVLEGKKLIERENKQLFMKGKSLEKRGEVLQLNLSKLEKVRWNKSLSLVNLEKIDEMVRETNKELMKNERKLEEINKVLTLGVEDRIKVGRNQSAGVVLTELKEKLKQKEIITQTAKLNEEEKQLLESTLRNWYQELKVVRKEVDFERGGRGKKKIWGGGVIKEEELDVGNLFCILDTLRELRKGRYDNLKEVIKLLQRNDEKLEKDVGLAMKACVLRDIQICYEDSCFIAKPKIMLKKEIRHGEIKIEKEGEEEEAEAMIIPTREIVEKENIIMTPRGKKFVKGYRLTQNERIMEERNKWLQPMESVTEVSELYEGYAIIVPVGVGKEKTEESFFENFRRLKDDIDYELEKPINSLEVMKVTTLKSPRTGEKVEFSYKKLREEIALLQEANKELEKKSNEEPKEEKKEQCRRQMKKNTQAVSKFVNFIEKWRNFLRKEVKDVEFGKEFEEMFKEEEAYNIPKGTIYKYKGGTPVVTIPEEPMFGNVKKVIGFEEDVPRGWKIEQIIITNKKRIEEKMGVEITLPSATGETLHELKEKLRVEAIPLDKRIEALKRLITIRNEKVQQLKNLQNKIIMEEITIEDIKDMKELEELYLSKELREIKRQLKNFELLYITDAENEMEILKMLKGEIKETEEGIKKLAEGVKTRKLYNIPEKVAYMSVNEFNLAYPIRLTKKKLREYTANLHYKLMNMWKAPREYNIEEGFTVAMINKEDVSNILSFEERKVKEEEEEEKKKKLQESIRELKKVEKSKKEDLPVKVMTKVMKLNIDKLIRLLKWDKVGLKREDAKLIIENIVYSGNYYKVDFVGNEVKIYRKPEEVSPFHPMTDGIQTIEIS